MPEKLNSNLENLPPLNPEIVKEANRWLVENKGTACSDKNYNSPRISSELPDCSMPMTFDSYSYCSMGCMYCCPAGTQIQMANGKQKAIERVRKGEYVLSFNTENCKPEFARVVDTMRRKNASHLFVLHLENGVILKLTGEHPVFTEHGWVEAKDLTERDKVLLW